MRAEFTTIEYALTKGNIHARLAEKSKENENSSMDFLELVYKNKTYAVAGMNKTSGKAEFFRWEISFPIEKTAETMKLFSEQTTRHAEFAELFYSRM